MKRIALINSVYNHGSTGRICSDLSEFLNKNGFEVKTFYGRNKNDYPDGIFFGSTFSTYLHGVLSRITDKHGFYSTAATRYLINQLEFFKPNLIILHNLHGYYLNISLLLTWISKKNIKVISVFHDCWNFTGHCAHFSLKKCDKWRGGCHNCPAKKDYPKSLLFDNSKKNYKIKKNLFLNINNLIVVSPSNWLSKLAKQSFFSNREVIVINNGIDINIFTRVASDFRTKYDLNNKKVILCIANVFDDKKGLLDVIMLAEMLLDNEIIVMVGKIKSNIVLPKNVIHINRTDNVEQLVEIYSASDVLVNPTYEDNYPTVNLEASCCNLPIICYKTGGAVESVDKMFLIEQGDVKGAKELMEKLFVGEIKYVFPDRELFSKRAMHEKYLKLINNYLK